MMRDLWPLCGLTLTTGTVELRLPDEAELAALAALAGEGVQRPGQRSFFSDWPGLPPAQRARSVLTGHWRQRGNWRPDDWSLDLAVFDAGEPVGMQAMRAEDYATVREVASSSWLGLRYQGRGIGTAMRAAMLHLAFEGLDAVAATSGSFMDNPAPLEVSRRLGYRPDGISRDAKDGEVLVSQRLRLTREDWLAVDRPAVTITGLAECRAEFGLPD